MKVTPRTFLVLIMAGALIAISVSPAKQLYKQWNEVKGLEKDLSSLKKQNRSLQEQVERLKTDAYIEEQARARLGLVKPGEQAYVIVPSKQSAKEEKAKEEARKKALAKRPKKIPTLWGRISGFFGGLFK